MYCEQCGTQIEEQTTSCPHCGFSRSVQVPPTKPSVPVSKSRRWWLLAFGVAIFSVLSFIRSSTTLPQDVVLEQLETIKEHQLTEAYYDYTSKDFQKAVSLDEFKRYIAATEALARAKSFILERATVDGGLSSVQGYIVGQEGNSIEVLYHLILEEDRWKILSFSPVERELREEAPQNSVTKAMIEPVKTFLDTIKTPEFEQSYPAIVADDLIRRSPYANMEVFIKDNPILTSFSDYEIVEHQLSRGRGSLYVLLNPEEEDVPIAFTVIKERGVWKIFRISMGASREKEALQTMERFEIVLVPLVKTSIQHLKDKNFTRFYQESASKEFREDVDIALLQRLVEEYPLLGQFTELSVKDRGEIGDLAWIDMEFKKGPAVWVVEFTLSKDSEDWKILGMKMSDFDSI